MPFALNDGVFILRRTPDVLRLLLTDLPDGWQDLNEGPGTWTPFDVVGHLIHGERTDWVPRVEHILRGEPSPFPPFDREAMFRESQGLTIDSLLDTFAQLRAASLASLAQHALTDQHMALRGVHPALGEVTLAQLLATWVTHDLTHINQVVRILARQYGDAVGPWRQYLSVLRTPTG